MCLAIPGRLIEMVDDAGDIARVEVAGVRRNVNIALLQGEERPRPGDYVLIHVGFALSRIDEREAMETQRALEELGQAYLDEVHQLETSSIT
ncbi:MAG TPA: HypC/HybG/HupF family hydrogenase formation chaperone [Candidatus Dormibacteraeota bacterium]